MWWYLLQFSDPILHHAREKFVPDSVIILILCSMLQWYILCQDK